MKPIPREGKNMVTISFEEFQRLHKSMLLMLHRILDDNRNPMLISHVDGASVIIYKPYDYRLVGIKVGEQTNLELYWVWLGKRLYEELVVQAKPMVVVPVSNHNLIFDRDVRVLSSSRSTGRYRINAALILFEHDIIGLKDSTVYSFFTRPTYSLTSPLSM